MSKQAAPRQKLGHKESWYRSLEEIKDQPSLQDGIEHHVVLKKKHNAFKFIERMRESLTFPQLIMNCAMVLYHRFYFYQSMKQFNWLEMAWCCLFAALKIEERVIKMDSLLKWSHHTWCALQRKEHTKLDVNGKEFFEMKERLQYNERMLLQTIGFDCDIVKTGFKVLTLIPTLMTERGIRKTLARVAFEWSHASYGGEFCLQFEPELMACVLIYGAAKDLSFEIKHPPGRKWWELCVPGTHVTETKLNDIMQEFHDFCQLYKEPRRAWPSSEKCLVRYVGPAHDDPSRTLIGLELSRPFGTHDGAVMAGTGREHRYFKCASKHGMLVSPASVQVLQAKPGPDGKRSLVCPPLASLKLGAEAQVVPPIPEGMCIPKNPRDYRPAPDPTEQAAVARAAASELELLAAPVINATASSAAGRHGEASSPKPASTAKAKPAVAVAARMASPEPARSSTSTVVPTGAGPHDGVSGTGNSELAALPDDLDLFGEPGPAAATTAASATAVAPPSAAGSGRLYRAAAGAVDTLSHPPPAADGASTAGDASHAATTAAVTVAALPAGGFGSGSPAPKRARMG